jgi:hypothetical protein
MDTIKAIATAARRCVKDGKLRHVKGVSPIAELRDAAAAGFTVLLDDGTELLVVVEKYAH